MQELDLWCNLCHEGRILLKQQIPEVCVFRGCRLVGWYHSNSNGCVVQRTQKTSIQEMCDHFIMVAAGGKRQCDAGFMEAPDLAPVAILRKSSTLFQKRSGAIDVPDASVLNGKELMELVQRVSAGSAEAPLWSVQTVVHPVEDVRVISMYSCDAAGEERSDVFGRHFRSVYSFDRITNIPSSEEVAADRCLVVPPQQRKIIESKTLGIIRFLSTHHHICLEGFILEFVFDAKNRAVLHGCWCASVSSEELFTRTRKQQRSN